MTQAPAQLCDRVLNAEMQKDSFGLLSGMITGEDSFAGQVNIADNFIE